MAASRCVITVMKEMEYISVCPDPGAVNALASDIFSTVELGLTATELNCTYVADFSLSTHTATTYSYDNVNCYVLE